MNSDPPQTSRNRAILNAGRSISYIGERKTHLATKEQGKLRPPTVLFG